MVDFLKYSGDVDELYVHIRLKNVYVFSAHEHRGPVKEYFPACYSTECIYVLYTLFIAFIVSQV